MKYVASMRMEHCATASGLDKLLRSLEHYLQQHPPMNDETFVHMIDMAQRLHNEKLLEQCRVAKARCQETYHLLLLRHNTLQRARDQLVAEHGVEGLGDILEDSAQEAASGAEKADSGKMQEVSASDKDTVKTGGVGMSSSSVKAGSVSLTASQPPSGDLKSVAEEEDLPVWEPRTSSSQGQEEGWSDAYCLSRSRPSSQRSGGHSSLSSPPVTDNKVWAAVKTPLSSPSPTSPSARLPTRPTPLDSPRHDRTEFKTPTGRGPSRLPLSRTISQPATTMSTGKTSPSSTSPSSSSSSSSSKPGPLKKMLKRASTAPALAAASSPVIYEDHQEASAVEAEGKRDQRGDKTLSMITGSSESLPR